MASKRGKKATAKTVESLRHSEDKRTNIPTAEHRSVLEERQKEARPVRYPRNTDLDPQLVWRGKDEQDWSDLVVHAPPLYIQEKVHPKVLIDDLLRRTREARAQEPGHQPDLFADFNGMPEGADRTEFYQHDQNWSNRMILGDSLQAMASLAEREGLRGKVQCIYIDPPYGIKFNSNFQWSTTSRDVKDGKAEHITREPEQVKAFRDTWRDGIHSYLTYLRDRLTVARDLLAESGSVFVQIGQDNCHLIRGLLDEIFGSDNFISQIVFAKTAGATSEFLSGTYDVLAFYAKSRKGLKYHQPLTLKRVAGVGGSAYRRIRFGDLSERAISAGELSGEEDLPSDARVFRIDNLTSQSVGREKGEGAASWFPVSFQGRALRPSVKVRWKTNEKGMERLHRASRLCATEKGLYYVRYFEDFAAFEEDNVWADTGIAGFASEKRYVVETSEKVVQRCLLMATDPGDLVLDPTCGSGTTACVAEQWGRRWITVDTSRVALALARARIMGARYPYYLLADSREGQFKEAEVTGRAPSSQAVHGNIRHGFVYERVPHVTLKSIASNAEIDVIWEGFEAKLEPLRRELSEAVGAQWIGRFRRNRRYDVDVPPTIQEWEVPREWPGDWPERAKGLHANFWELRIARQQAIDASIASKAEVEYLYDKPYEDRKTVRVAGPFTVESLSPHRVLAVDADDELIDPLKVRDATVEYEPRPSFDQMILENLRTAGVQQAHREDRIVFTSLAGWPGDYICAEGRYREGETEKRAGIFLGPEFGTVSRPDLVDAAREAGDAGFDVLIACAFNYEAHATEFNRLGRVAVLKARMNADLHMAADLKATDKGNLFVVFGEPDIEVLSGEEGQIRVKVNGVDVFDPSTGEVRSDGADGIACWFVDSDYNGESFFVRQAYFLGASDPYKALKTTLKAEIDEDAWATLHSDTSRPFRKPESGRIAVKVINHLGDEVMKVFKV
jgi:adenine-specific DNA-methyltransferase